ncbi:bifunctional 2-polyprenyl-6-hydroxyphenol methylase/3-demethylubiquinol 3-O-methyltransferase UbiG [Aeromicrobium sp.]|uniref:class I SAM-dependent methyltransferase n=1 Tax=Aeromicrobium sp. TaxID=1871063 RepID=UPI0019828812|nr:class I SAM-dependent methyltransferase [Aeromicrobium sp.]MBC7630443.1 class I SAM-dependent methyltransferase [Aeromicrobium sp.]
MSDSRFEPRAYWENRLRAHPNIHGVGYLNLGQAYNTWLYRVRAAVFDAVVNSTSVRIPTASILDAGSGTGFYLDRWLGLGATDVRGLDLTTVSTSLLRARFPQLPIHTVDLGSEMALEELGLAPATVDLVSCMDVLFHIVDDQRYKQALANISTLLRTGGYLILSDNFLHGPEVRLEHHVSRSLVTVTAMLEGAGFEIIRRRPMLYLMNAPVDSNSRRLARWEGMIRRLTAREPLGWLTGALMYPLERILVATCNESPSTEILLCRRVGHPS